jgi:hypothetical protein
MKRIEYTTLFDEGVRKRHVHERRGKKILNFSVQLEVFTANRWTAVVRYDCAHGFSHIDQYWQSGRKKKILLNLSFEKALVLADWDIKTGWQKYVKEFFGKGR